ncbi:VCBS repeat-containing protein [Leeuwenhoekiella sp. W20_SRS_FM14]|uniref:VCBS repeat-containing protein n=1 Tax=Leeuwenhoekiella sp. W20_SRS_FM14 TaxID=3240270 RepID=UPI003F96878D
MHRFSSYFKSILLILSVASCTSPKTDEAITKSSLFKLHTSKETGVDFTNTIVENADFNMVDYFYVYNGGGVALGDINNDGLTDIYFTGNFVDDKLYLNLGDFKFKDITVSAGINKPGWSTGVTMIDINHDGLLDIYVSRSGNYTPEKRANLLYINQGDTTFKEQAATYGLADTSYSTQAAFLDYDHDGDLDMYLLNHSNEIRDPNNVKALTKDGSGLANDRFYKNMEVETGNINFTDVTLEAGILYDGMGLGIGTADVNNDGWDDIFITNDFIANDYLYLNNQDGTFTEKAHAFLGHNSHFSMGNDLADFNNDGLVDIVTADMLPPDNFQEKKMSGPLNNDLFQYTLQEGYLPQYMRNNLQINTGGTSANEQSFSEVGQLVGIDATSWSWAPLFADFDNDGLKDLYITNGYLRDITDLDFINYTSTLSGNPTLKTLDSILKNKAKTMPALKLANYMFKNTDSLRFENVSNPWGLSEPSLSNGAAYADLDNDGDLDLVVNNINAEAFIYENEISNGNYLRVSLTGDSLNTFAFGSEISLFQDGKIQKVKQSVTRGYQSSVDPILHFGLTSQKIDSLIISWPTGKMGILKNVKANQLLKLSENDLAEYIPKAKSKPEQFMVEISKKSSVNYLHTDPFYNDFNRQFLLPHKHSFQGPGIAVGDINNDGYEDFFIGGAYNQSGQIFKGSKNGTFTQTALVANEKEKFEEDTGVLLFDADNDGDLDLYIASGSNEFYPDSEFFQDRLYINDGLGNFKLNPYALPQITASGSCVRAADFDKDGDLDLFVGGRLSALKYPLPGQSYLLVNENGVFKDKTKSLAPSLSKLGMVTDALWSDYDNDGDTDLVVVGEFMAIQFIKNENGIFENKTATTGLSKTSGWWNSINAGDFDNDGDIDYVVGNLGLNTKYQVSSEEPMTVYALDYDNNGSLDPILATYKNGVQVLVHSRDDLIKQIPAMKKKFPNYASYANASLNEVLTSQEKSRAYSARAFTFASSVLMNNGDGTFAIHSLPTAAQLGPIYSILVDDVNNDSILDLIVSGNDFGTSVDAGRYDALKGLILSGNGTGGFQPMGIYEDGLNLEGQVRGSAVLAGNQSSRYLFGRNSDSLTIYEPSNAKAFKTLQVNAFAAKGLITYKNGKKRALEFYYGSSYLSQSTRSIKIDETIAKIEVENSKGEKSNVFENKL